jgi:hypothetical protein
MAKGQETSLKNHDYNQELNPYYYQLSYETFYEPISYMKSYYILEK